MALWCHDPRVVRSGVGRRSRGDRDVPQCCSGIRVAPVAQPLIVRRGPPDGLAVRSRVEGVRLSGRIHEVRDASVHPHRSHVITPGLQIVKPVDAISLEDPTERRSAADTLRRVAQYLGPIDGGVLRRVAGEVGQRPRCHRVRDLDELRVRDRRSRGFVEEDVRYREDIARRQRDGFVELLHCHVAHLRATAEGNGGRW